MKRLCMITLSIFLLLSQLGTLTHDHHAHQPGEVCDYCLSAQPLDHAITNSVQAVALKVIPQWHDEQLQNLISARHVRHYASRAPPCFI